MSDLQGLIARAQLGDGSAYESIVQQFQDTALSYAYSILGDYDLAEDARQEAFLSAYCDLLSLRSPSAFPAWFRKIVRTHSIRLQRSRHVLFTPIESVPEIPSREPGPTEIAEAREAREKVRGAIDRLPEREQEVTRLFYIEDRSLKEISRLLDIPQTTVVARLRVARARLWQKLMELAKHTIRKRHLSGDKRAFHAANDEAISQFGNEADSILRAPTEKEQEYAASLLCARGRMERFMGRMDDAIASFRKGMMVPVLKQDRVRQARFQAEIGLTLIQKSEYVEAHRSLKSARASVGTTKDRSPLLAAILLGLGSCAWGRGRFRVAREFYEEALRESKRVGCEELEGEALNNIALLDWKNGELTAALRSFRVCIRRWKRIKYRFGEALTTMNVGVIEENLGRYAQAKRHYHEGLALARDVNFLQVQAAACTNLANLALVQNDVEVALERSTQALELAQQASDRRSQAIALENQALAYSGLGRVQEARRVLLKARRIAVAIADGERIFSLELVAIEQLLMRKQRRGIGGRIEQARKTLDRSGYTSELPRLLRLQFHAQILDGAGEAASATLKEAIAECRRQKNRVEEGRIRLLAKQLG